MHKHLCMRVVSAVLIFITTSLSVSIVKADNPSSPWIYSGLSIQQQSEPVSPTSLYPNLDCANDGSGSCTLSTLYGVGTTNSTAGSSNESISLGDKGHLDPVFTYVENRQRYFPIPNSNTAISYASGPAIGSYIYFNYNFTASIARTGGLGTLQPVQYHITHPPDGKLADKSSRLLAADMTSIGFSSNGRWMIVSDPNVSILRVNLETFEVLPFAPGFSYTLGQDPAVRSAITNDGRYAVVASANYSTFKIYDLDTCAGVPAAITGPVTCQSRDLQSYARQQVPSYSFIASARFMNDDSLGVYAVYKPGGVNKTARFIISDNGAGSQLDYLALGDSYISGEGAFDYVPGTDSPVNKCHLSYLSYPFLIGYDLNYNSFHSVACSGATTNDIINTRDDYVSQASKKNHATRAQLDAIGQSDTALSSFLPGYIDQLDFVRHYQPKTITISIGGNNANMIGTLKSCFSPGTCMDNYEDRLEIVNNISSHFDEIYATYDAIKKAGPPDMRVYAIGYPQIAKPGGDCALNVHLNSDEVLFTNQAIDYLDSVVKAAAKKAGVLYVDARDALYGHRLCEAKPGSVAVNGITAGNDILERFNGPFGNESFHPNTFGYELLENKVLAATKNLTAPMPNADPSAAAPTADGQEILNAPRSGRPVNAVEYDPDISADLAYQSVPFDVNINGSAHWLAHGTSLAAEIHSSPIKLGSYKTGSDGSLSVQLAVPGTVAPGYHSLHFYGTGISGQPIDIYKDIYIAFTADDLDGNGVSDSLQKCIGIEPAGQDYDEDGIDDSCDGLISEPPVRLGGSASSRPVSSTVAPISISSSPAAGLSTPTPISTVNPNISAAADSADVSPKVLSAKTAKEKTAEESASNSFNLTGIELLLGFCGLLAGVFLFWLL